MRIAILDLGTNTFNLLIADIKEKHPIIILKTKIPVKLGKGGLSKNIISPDAYSRGLNALSEHKATIEKYDCTKIFAFATSAIRSTENGKQFVEDVKNQLNIIVQIISGDREAELIYKGVKQALTITENSCIMDIGGGSTEFIICNNKGILWKKSYQLGVSRLYELLEPHDPLTQECVLKAELYIDKELSELLEQLKHYNASTLIGSSGSFDTFFDIISLKYNLPKSNNNWEEINLSYFKELHQQFTTLNVTERLAMPGMIEMRADMIPFASLLVNYVLNKHLFQHLKISHFALKEGVMQEIIEDL